VRTPRRTAHDLEQPGEGAQQQATVVHLASVRDRVRVRVRLRVRVRVRVRVRARSSGRRRAVVHACTAGAAATIAEPARHALRWISKPHL